MGLESGVESIEEKAERYRQALIESGNFDDVDIEPGTLVKVVNSMDPPDTYIRYYPLGHPMRPLW